MVAPLPQTPVADSELLPPVIIKKIIVSGHGGHHGGAWKVAYADFVTAMMAFFLLLWIVGATNEDQRKGIADYFAPTLVQHTKAGGSNGVMGGRAMMAPDGNAPNAIPAGSQRVMPVTMFAQAVPPTPEERLANDKAKKEDVKAFTEAARALQARMSTDRNLALLRDQVRLTMTDDGLRIDILDKADFAMFQMGTDRLLAAVAESVNRMPNPIAIAGHTDALPYPAGRKNNWLLSAERAEIARNNLVNAGVDPGRFARLEGLADRDPYNAANPYDPLNRRISVTLLFRAPAGMPPKS
jgi:chemotaxis protein MotB